MADDKTPDGTGTVPFDFPPPPGADVELPPLEPEAAAPAKRGPGRPKGSANRTAATAKKATPPPRVKVPGPAPKLTGDSAPKKGPGRPPKARIKDHVSQSAEMVAALLTMAGSIRGDDRLVYDGAVIGSRAAEIGDTVHEIAEANPAIKRGLERLFEVSGWGKIGLTVAQVAVPIMACHGVLPPWQAAMFVVPSVGLPPMRPEVERRGAGSPVPPAPAPAPVTDPVQAAPAPSDTIGSHPDLPGWPADMPLPDVTPIEGLHLIQPPEV